MRLTYASERSWQRGGPEPPRRAHRRPAMGLLGTPSVTFLVTPVEAYFSTGRSANPDRRGVQMGVTRNATEGVPHSPPGLGTSSRRRTRRWRDNVPRARRRLSLAP